MKIFSEILECNDPNNNIGSLFVLYLDTENTGDRNKDIKHCAHPISEVHYNDPDLLIGMLIPMLSELIEASYGNSQSREPLTNWHATGFDRNYPNGVKV